MSFFANKGQLSKLSLKVKPKSSLQLYITDASLVVSSLVTLIPIVISSLFIRIFYFPEITQLRVIWSYWYEDKPWTPQNLIAEKIFGDHYFGDFQLAIVYSSLRDPFLWDGEGLAYGYPPVFHQLFKVFSQFPIRVSFAIFLILSLISVFYASQKALFNVSKSISIPVTVLLMSWCLPLFISIDRGNFVVIAVALTATVMFSAFNDEIKTKKQELFAVIALYVAISLKLYIVVFVFFLLFLGFKRVVFKLFGMLTVTNLIAIIIFYSDPFQVPITFINSILLYADNSDPLFVLQGVGLFSSYVTTAGLITRSIDLNNIAITYGSFANYLGYIWFVATLVVVFSKRLNLNPSSRCAFALTNIQFFAPVSMTYTGIWMIFACSALIGHILYIHKNKLPTNFSHVSILFVVTFVGMAPFPFQNFKYFSAISWSVILLYYLLIIFFSYLKKFKVKIF